MGSACNKIHDMMPEWKNSNTNHSVMLKHMHYNPSLNVITRWTSKGTMLAKYSKTTSVNTIDWRPEEITIMFGWSVLIQFWNGTLKNSWALIHTVYHVFYQVKCCVPVLQKIKIRGKHKGCILTLQARSIVTKQEEITEKSLILFQVHELLTLFNQCLIFEDMPAVEDFGWVYRNENWLASKMLAGFESCCQSALTACRTLSLLFELPWNIHDPCLFLFCIFILISKTLRPCGAHNDKSPSCSSLLS